MGYFHVCTDDPAPSVLVHAKRELTQFPPDHLWLKLTAVAHAGDSPDPKASHWQLYTRIDGILTLAFCYVPQYPSCYARIAPRDHVWGTE